jgi:hypothetical protein
MHASFFDELEKISGKGEGSRGGKVVGRRKGGRAVYSSEQEKDEKNLVPTKAPPISNRILLGGTGVGVAASQLPMIKAHIKGRENLWHGTNPTAAAGILSSERGIDPAFAGAGRRAGAADYLRSADNLAEEVVGQVGQEGREAKEMADKWTSATSDQKRARVNRYVMSEQTNRLLERAGVPLNYEQMADASKRFNQLMDSGLRSSDAAQAIFKETTDQLVATGKMTPAQVQEIAAKIQPDLSRLGQRVYMGTAAPDIARWGDYLSEGEQTVKKHTDQAVEMMRKSKAERTRTMLGRGLRSAVEVSTGGLPTLAEDIYNRAKYNPDLTATMTREQALQELQNIAAQQGTRKTELEAARKAVDDAYHEANRKVSPPRMDWDAWNAANPYPERNYDLRRGTPEYEAAEAEYERAIQNRRAAREAMIAQNDKLHEGFWEKPETKAQLEANWQARKAGMAEAAKKYRDPQILFRAEVPSGEMGYLTDFPAARHVITAQPGMKYPLSQMVDIGYDPGKDISFPHEIPSKNINAVDIMEPSGQTRRINISDAQRAAKSPLGQRLKRMVAPAAIAGLGLYGAYRSIVPHQRMVPKDHPLASRPKGEPGAIKTAGGPWQDVATVAKYVVPTAAATGTVAALGHRLSSEMMPAKHNPDATIAEKSREQAKQMGRVALPTLGTAALTAGVGAAVLPGMLKKRAPEFYKQLMAGGAGNAKVTPTRAMRYMGGTMGGMIGTTFGTAGALGREQASIPEADPIYTAAPAKVRDFVREHPSIGAATRVGLSAAVPLAIAGTLRRYYPGLFSRAVVGTKKLLSGKEVL